MSAMTDEEQAADEADDEPTVAGEDDAETKDQAPNPESDDPAAGRDRLEALQQDIDDVRQQVGAPREGEEQTEREAPDADPAFIQEGEASEDQPVDDTIAPG